MDYELLIPLEIPTCALHLLDFALPIILKEIRRVNNVPKITEKMYRTRFIPIGRTL